MRVRPAVGSAGVDERRTEESGQAEPDDLHGSCRDLAPRERAEVALEPLVRGSPDEVIERTEDAGRQRDDRRRSGGSDGRARREAGGDGSDGGHGCSTGHGATDPGGPLEKGDGGACVVGARPWVADRGRQASADAQQRP